jgi:hypothetical protein
MAIWMPTRTGHYQTETTHRRVTVERGSLARRIARLAVDPRRAALHLATVVVVAALAGVPGSDVSPLLYGWLALALLDMAFTSGWSRMLGGHGEDADFTPPPDSGVVMTGSISSTVKLDYDAGTAEKSYAPGRFVRALYRLSFQAPFPYTSNLAAVQAARHRRSVIGLLTQYWYGENLVAPALDVRLDADGKIVFVSELVRGTPPKDLPRARSLLADLTKRFLEAGLPSWQVASYNPRSIGNLIERDDGAFRIIDLESNLVTPILPLGAAVRAIRAGLYPSFDEIDVARLNAYLDAHRESLTASLGEAGAGRLFAVAEDYAAAQQAWHAGEPRVASKALRFVFRLVDIPEWWRSVQRLTAGGERLAENFTSAGIATWENEGRLTPSEATRIRSSLALPEVAAATAGLGAHMAMSVPLRFPLGSIARSAWTLGLRAKAEWNALRGRGTASSARQVHSLTVAIAAGIPGLGTFAYTLAKPLRQQRALGAIALDQVLRHLSMRAYRGIHLDTLTLWMARTPPVFAARGLAAATQEWLRAMGSTLVVAVTVVAANAALVLADVSLDRPEGPLTRSISGTIEAAVVVEVLIAGAAGLLAFQAYWRRFGTADLDTGAGMFLWGFGALFIAAVGLDYGIGIHEAVFGFTAEHINVFPLLTDPSEHLIVMAYLTLGLPIVLLLRHELFSGRASATWLGIALISGGALVAGTFVSGMEDVTFVLLGLTGAALLTAFASRLFEVSVIDQTACEPGFVPVSGLRRLVHFGDCSPARG